MNYKFVRFFSGSSCGTMQWDSIKDEDDIWSRHMDGARSQKERDEIELALRPNGALTKPGGFLKLDFEVFVRVAP
jgi:hypothetical protein